MTLKNYGLFVAVLAVEVVRGGAHLFLMLALVYSLISTRLATTTHLKQCLIFHSFLLFI